MDSVRKRIILFLLGCMGTRAGLTYFVKNNYEKYREILVFLLLIPAIGFTYIYANDLRKTGREVF